MDWTRGRTVGRGSTAIVSIASDNRNGEVFAVKSAEISNSEALQREERILSKLVCPQIVAYKGSNISSENGRLSYNLFLEYAPGGTLTDAIRRSGDGGMEEGRIRSYTRAILLGLEYLHSNGIVHCDIKGQNVLITGGGAKIADLGCARRLDEVSRGAWGSMMPISGTPVYMAPEVARGEDQGFPADVWAVGCTVIEMLTGQAPWADVFDPVSALYRIGFSSDGPEIPKFMSKQGQDFLSKCLKRNPAERFSARELLKHDFVNEDNFPCKEIGTCNPETPTSVLNRGIWNTIERLEETWNSNSAKERIRKLSEGNSEMINWELDETWITVRSNGSKESGRVASSGGASDTDISSASSEEHSMDIPDEVFTTNSEIYAGKISSDGRKHERISFMACKFTNDILCRNISLMNKKFCISNATIACVEPNSYSSYWLSSTP